MTWRNVLAMLVLVALAAGAAFWLRPGEGTERKGPSTLLAAFDRKDVTRVEAKFQGVELKLRRRGGDSEVWEMQAGMDFVRADAARVDDLLGALIRSEVRRSFAPSEVDAAALREYGLDAPELSFTLQLPGGERSARFGRTSREGENVYADRGPGTDVLVVPVDAFRDFAGAFTNSLRDLHVTDLRAYDIQRIEVARRGVTTLEASVDPTSIWRVTQPYKGYAERQAFMARLSQIVGEECSRVVEDGAQDLARYGLVQPEAEVTLTSKRGAVRTLFVGAADAELAGGRYVMEKDTHSVLAASKRFADAVLGDAAELRDRAFARVGFGIVGVTVKLGETAYVLKKTHHDWEIESPGREPADEKAVEDFLEAIRQWHTAEFLDRAQPGEYGIEPEGDQIEIALDGGAKTKLLIGNTDASGRLYAQRADDGGVEVVLAGPVDRAKLGWLQFKRKSALELPIEDIEFLAREPGFGEEGSKLTAEKWRRDLSALDKDWKADMGVTGSGLDATAMNGVLAALRSVTALEWRHWDRSKAEEYGFAKDGGGAATCWFEIGLRGEFGAEPGAPGTGTYYLLIGSKLPDRDAYYALRKGQDYAFLLDGGVVRQLTAPLMKTE